MNELLYKIGLRLGRVGFVKKAIADRADLSAFRKRPTFRILFGVFLIGFSYVICWPAITALGAIAAHQRKPLLFALGGPTLYGLSHLCFIAGMALSGAEYSVIFLRWAARVGVERLLKFGPATDQRS